MSEILAIENLTKRFSSFVAVDNLNLKIEENQCIGFLGPNGAGKTTTIKILVGLLKPTSGNAYINGVDVTKDIRSALSGVGIVVETPQFYSNLTPNEILTYFGKLRGVAEKKIDSRIEEMLKLVNLLEWKEKKIGTFSKGMKQRLGIASALLHDPKLVILDEPTTGLDPRGMIEIREIIKTLKNEGKTILMSSHLLAEVQEVCDKIAIIDKGKLVRFEDVKSISTIENLSTIAIETLVPISKEQTSNIENLSGVNKIISKSENEFNIEFTGNNEAKAALLDSVQKIGIKLLSFKTTRSELESLYMDATSQSGE